MRSARPICAPRCWMSLTAPGLAACSSTTPTIGSSWHDIALTELDAQLARQRQAADRHLGGSQRVTRSPRSRHGITTALLMTFNEVIDLDTERKISRTMRMPTEVLQLLLRFPGPDRRRAWLCPRRTPRKDGRCRAVPAAIALRRHHRGPESARRSGNIRESQDADADAAAVAESAATCRVRSLPQRGSAMKAPCDLPSRPSHSACAAGCVQGPDYEKPAVEVPPAYRFGDQAYMLAAYTDSTHGGTPMPILIWTRSSVKH